MMAQISKTVSEAKLFSVENVRIGLLGGTFDPPHFAHIHMAQEAQKALGLDFVVFMPLGIPPHGKGGISKATHRIAMLEIILAGHEGFYIDTEEAYLDKPSYTVDSIERINGMLGDNSSVYFIVGADSLMYLEKWYDAKRLFEITKFAVIPRAGFEKAECMEHIAMLQSSFGANITYIDADGLDYSSTEIRNRRGTKDTELTTAEVYEYIKENGLYNP